MRKALIAFGTIAIVLVIGVLSYIPLSASSEICKPVAQWDGSNAGWRLNHPMDLAWSAGFVYVADAENGAVKKFRDDGTLVADWKGFKLPVAVAVARDAIYVADFLADQVVKLGPDGAVIARWGRHGTGPGEFDAPSGVAVDIQGNVYVTEFYNHRVQVLNTEGGFLRQWGRPGRWNGQLHYPTDLAVGPTGEVFVADAYNHRVEVFTADGAYLRKWGGIDYGVSGKWGGWFRLAKALDIDSAKNIYVADAFNRRIQKFSTDGRLLGAWGNGPAMEQQVLQYPAGVAAGDRGVVYVTDYFENRVWKLDCGG